MYEDKPKIKKIDPKIDPKKPHKYNNELCDDDMSFQDCEMAILRHAVEESEEAFKNKMVNGKEITNMVEIVETFLMRKKLVCYGGTAINNILPKHAQFYNRDTEIPDYDFYSPEPLKHAKELADVFYAQGYEDVEAKSGVHYGTYKVFVNFIPMADITYLPNPLFENILAESITIAGIKYAPPNFLRMNMFLELSRPAGDISRWDKVLKRLTLLNEYYPFKAKNCREVDFQRKTDTPFDNSEELYMLTRDTFIETGVVFFGGYASSLYSRYMPKKLEKWVQKIPDFDVLSENPEKTATILAERLSESGFKGIQIVKHDAIGEIVPRHLEIRINKETIAFIYEPFACHNYNIIHIGNKEVMVATIDTMLSFYLAFYYVNKPYYDKDRILCLAKFLFELEQRNRLEQKGLLKRYSYTCYGKQSTLEDIRAEKAKKFKELANDRNGTEYEKWFLKYNPLEHASKKKTKTNDKTLLKDTEKKTSVSKKSMKTKETKITPKINPKINPKQTTHAFIDALPKEVELLSKTPDDIVKTSSSLDSSIWEEPDLPSEKVKTNKRRIFPRKQTRKNVNKPKPKEKPKNKPNKPNKPKEKPNKPKESEYLF